jgi:hypothetical protein
MQAKRHASPGIRIFAEGYLSQTLVVIELGRSGHEPTRPPHRHVRAARGGPRPDLERAGPALDGTGRAAGAVCFWIDLLSE